MQPTLQGKASEVGNTEDCLLAGKLVNLSSMLVFKPVSHEGLNSSFGAIRTLLPSQSNPFRGAVPLVQAEMAH